MSYIHVYSTRINWENEPSITSPINATNLNKMDYALKAMDDTFGNWDVTKANESDLLLALKDVSYDTDTGVFVFEWFNGTTATIDLNIEKIPVSFSMDANGVIAMTTEDGTTYTADVGALIKTYTFNDSSVIDFTVTTDASGNKTVTADIVDGSIDGTKLTPNYLADCTAAKTLAETAASDADDSSEDAEAWAVGTRGGVPVPSTDPTYQNNAEYWAHHTSASFAGLNDVSLTSPTNGQVPAYNSTTQKWENVDPSGGVSRLRDLSDVTITSPAQGQFLRYDSGKWRNKYVAMPSPRRLYLNITTSGAITSVYAMYFGDRKDLYNVDDDVLYPDYGQAPLDTYYIDAEELCENFSNEFGWTFYIEGEIITPGGTTTFTDTLTLPAYVVTSQYIEYGVTANGSGTAAITYVKQFYEDEVNNSVNAVSSAAVKKTQDATTLAVDLTGWTTDTTSQSGTTLYKKAISLTSVYVESPSVDIGAGTGYVLPTSAEQESYNLLQYVTCDDSVPCLYLYASEIPTTAFYIKVTGVE